MKIVCLLLPLISLCALSTFAAPKKDSTQLPAVAQGDSAGTNKAKASKGDSLDAKSMAKKMDSMAATLKSLQDSASAKNCGCTPNPNPKPIGLWNGLLSFAPLILFLFIFIGLGIPKGFLLKDALTENEQTTRVIANPEYNTANILALKDVGNLTVLLPSTIEVTDASQPASASYRPSISRYIAFLASLLTIIIAVCMSCFFIYHYLSTGCPPDLTGLTIVLITLGIGVAPYAFNKISAAIATNKS